MIRNHEERPLQKREIDLRAEEGNAYVIMGYARRWGRQLGLDTDLIIAEMMSGDYDNLIQVFDDHFGEYVTIWK
jgi:hypothetical protein